MIPLKTLKRNIELNVLIYKQKYKDKLVPPEDGHTLMIAGAGLEILEKILTDLQKKKEELLKEIERSLELRGKPDSSEWVLYNRVIQRNEAKIAQLDEIMEGKKDE